MDEVPLGCGITAEELAEVSEKISPLNFLWLACQSQLHPSSDDLKECGKLFVLLKMDLSSFFFIRVNCGTFKQVREFKIFISYSTYFCQML
jgi:hypothetical protein